MLIIAIGNRLMKDDAISILVIEHLKDKFEELGIEVIICETDYQYCIRFLEKQNFVVIVDSLYKKDTPGKIHIFNLSSILSLPINNAMQHDMNFIECIKLYNKNIEGFLIGIETGEIDFSMVLSSQLIASFDNICSKIEELILNIYSNQMYYI